MKFFDKLKVASVKAKSLVCVGLDSDHEKLPSGLPRNPEGVFEFNRVIIENTKDFACAYKPNSAFYEAMGAGGITALKKTCGLIPPHIPIILDVKRGDISNTAFKYAEFAYDEVGADAVTINPYMGFDAVKPFMREGKCVFVLCLTSNKSANDFQMLETDGSMLFEKVAETAVKWSMEGEIGLVVGATKPGLMRRVREIAPELPFLVPGVGAQGGDIEAVLDECGSMDGLTVINSSRGIIFASDGLDYGKVSGEKLIELRDEINLKRFK